MRWRHILQDGVPPALTGCVPPFRLRPAPYRIRPAPFPLVPFSSGAVIHSLG